MPGFTGAWNVFVWVYISWICAGNENQAGKEQKADEEHPAGREDQAGKEHRADEEHPAGKENQAGKDHQADEEHPAGKENQAVKEHQAGKLAWRFVVKSYRKRKAAQAALQSVDDETECVTSDDEKPEDKEHSETAETYISKIKRRGFRKKPEVKFNKDAFNRDIGGSKPSIFGGRTNLSELHAAAEKGLEASDDSFKKVTTYYDKSGKLVYKKEKDVVVPPPPLQKPNVESLDPIKPSFHLKPQPPSWDQDEYKAYIEGSDDKFAAAKNRVDADIDKAFNEIYESLPKI